MLYYEDMVPGETLTGATFVVDEKEMVEFAQRWDPVPFHVDRRAGEAANSRREKRLMPSTITSTSGRVVVSGREP